MRKASGGSSSSGSLSKATGFSAFFRGRGTVASMDEASGGGTDTDSEISLPEMQSRSHSLMDASESLRWRKLASEGAHGSRSVTLTPINVTTINKTCYYLVRVESPDSSWVVPRTFEQFRDFRQNLVFEFPSATVPQPPSKVPPSKIFFFFFFLRLFLTPCSFRFSSM